MKYLLSLITSLALTAGIAYSQADKEAFKVLDAFSAKASGAPSVTMKFILVTSSQVENTTDTLNGSVIISKDRYRLELPGNTIFFNGESSWSYLTEEKEVTITKVDKTDNSFMNRPASVFTMYRNGYKVRLIEEKIDRYVIDLYPEDIKSEMIRVRLTIGKPALNLIDLEYKRRDGITSVLRVLSYDLKQKVQNETFTFQKEKYKGVEVIDMR